MEIKFSPPNELLNPVEELIGKDPANCANNLVSVANNLKSIAEEENKNFLPRPKEWKCKMHTPPIEPRI
jgi:hypothetical protein